MEFNKNYTPGPDQDSLQSEEINREMFRQIAGYYDFTNRILSLGFDGYWRRCAIRELSPKNEGIYLDVGCGTGDVAIKIAESAPHSKIIGMDTSSDMLGIAARKMSRRGLANSIQLKIGNITHIQAAQDSFDGVITSFCIRNVVDRTKALSEMYRVMKPGGKLVILELTDPSGLMRIPFRIYSAVMMPLLTKIMSSVSAYRYLTDSMAAFPSSEDFSSLIASQGFRSVSFKKLTGGISTLFAATK